MSNLKFKFVYIPFDDRKPIEELTQEIPPGKEVECLLDRLKEHFRSIKPKRTPQELAAQQAEFRRNLPGDTDISAKLLDMATSMQMVESVALLSHSKDNSYIGINMYVDDEGSLRGMPRNVRATELAHCCGLPIEVKGDAFLGRVLDDGDAFERLDFSLNEVSSSAPWVKQAQQQQERRRQQESAESLLSRMQQNPKTKAAIKELTPAESAKEDGNVAFKRGDWQAAEAAYTKALELDPGLVVALNNRAMARLKMQQWRLAEDDCSAVLDMDGGNIKALLRRATAREGLGKIDEAKQDLLTTMEKQPTNKDAQAKLDTLNAETTQ